MAVSSCLLLEDGCSGLWTHADRGEEVRTRISGGRVGSASWGCTSVVGNCSSRRRQDHIKGVGRAGLQKSADFTSDEFPMWNTRINTRPISTRSGETPDESCVVAGMTIRKNGENKSPALSSGAKFCAAGRSAWRASPSTCRPCRRGRVRQPEPSSLPEFRKRGLRW